MNFLSPAFLIGLPLVAVPVIIHLLSRRQQKKISWGAMRFLMQAATRKRRIWKITDLLLLLLRTAAFAFFIFALARPLMPATWLGGSVPREVILVLDQSLSMSRQGGSGTLFELHLQKANEVLDGLKPSDSVRVLLAGETPEWLTPDAMPAAPAAVRKLRTQINELKPTLGAGDLVACVREAADLEAAKDKSARVIVVITDGQRFGWRMEERPLWAAVQARLEQAAIPTSVSLQAVGSDEPAGNLCVNNVNAPRAFGAANQALTFTATVQNHSPQPSAATLLNWRVNGQPAGANTLPELGPSASTTLTLSHQFDAVGPFEVSCRLETDDELSADNEGRLLVEIYERLPILFVEDPASAEPLQNDAPFVLAALGQRKTSEGQRDWRSVFEPTVIDSAALASTELEKFRCVVLANVRELAPESLAKVESYVHNGGGVWLVLGSHTQEQFFNERLHRGGLGLAPMKIAAPVGDPNDRERFFSVRATSDSHPATALLADFQRLDLDRARIYRRHQFEPFSGKDVSILLQAQSGEPVVVERKLGRGRVLVQGIPLGVSWSTLPLCQAYVAMLHEWLWYLSEPSLPKRNLIVGESIAETAATKNQSAVLTLPDSRKVELNAIASGSGAQFRFAGTRLPGEYTLAAKGDKEKVSRFFVQRNPQESDLRPLTDADREQLASTKLFHINTGVDTVASAARLEIPKHPLEGWLLGLLAAVLLGEIALAGWMTHRRNLRVTPVTMG
jgi:hypothetical protein